MNQYTFHIRKHGNLFLCLVLLTSLLPFSILFQFDKDLRPYLFPITILLTVILIFIVFFYKKVFREKVSIIVDTQGEPLFHYNHEKYALKDLFYYNQYSSRRMRSIGRPPIAFKFRGKKEIRFYPSYSSKLINEYQYFYEECRRLLKEHHLEDRQKGFTKKQKRAAVAFLFFLIILNAVAFYFLGKGAAGLTFGVIAYGMALAYILTYKTQPTEAEEEVFKN